MTFDKNDLVERLRHTFEDEAADRIEELEAKLAKAVDALEAGVICTTKHGGAAEFLRIARTALAELKGQDDE
jgi:ADP-dependent phosphofructokinase/glucokinase